MAITERAKTAWAPRWRGSFTLSTSPSKIKRYCRKQIHYGKKQLLSVKEHLIGDERMDESTESLSTNVILQTVHEKEEESSEPLPSDSQPETETRLLLDYMGGMDSRSDAVVIDGDEFFDGDDAVVDKYDDDQTVYDDAISQSAMLESHLSESGSALYRTAVLDQGGLGKAESAGLHEESPAEAVFLEETPLPKMFIPGKIVHVYSYRGVYNAAYVPRTFRELRRISLAGNMLSDHKSQSYYQALIEVRTVRSAAEAPPRWTAFDEDITCSCCASQFTWASTSDSEAQEARDKHNCRSCGTLVCNPCSTNRVPVPSIGLTVPCRVCDRCYNAMDGIVPNAVQIQDKNGAGLSTTEDGRPVRQRERRSAVVDELAARVQASPLTCT